MSVRFRPSAGWPTQWPASLLKSMPFPRRRREAPTHRHGKKNKVPPTLLTLIPTSQRNAALGSNINRDSIETKTICSEVFDFIITYGLFVVGVPRSYQMAKWRSASTSAMSLSSGSSFMWDSLVDPGFAPNCCQATIYEQNRVSVVLTSRQRMQPV